MTRTTSIRRALLAWFRRHRRDLPWRNTRDPYAIWVSEIMLQQTRVETVVDYYQRFLQKFPTVASLAHAPEDDVLKLWEGLGYYSRALNLHKAAGIVVHKWNGRFPRTAGEWQSLPGVGRYTAGAIASIAYGIRAPVLDGNVKRVLTRLYAIPDRLDRSDTIHRLWQLADELVSPRSPGDFNQAMMELGARLCLPKKPLCEQCPIHRWCDALQQGNPEAYPLRTPKKSIPHYEVVAAAIYKNGRYLLGKRPPGGLLGGLWEFPGGKVEKGETHEEALRREIREEIGIEVDIGERIASVDHGYSHYTVTIHLYRCTHTDGVPQTIYHSRLRWTPKSQFQRLSFPAANLRFFPYL